MKLRQILIERFPVVFNIFLKGFSKPCTHFHPATSTSIYLHPAPSTSTQLSATCSTLLEPNIASNWGISPNLGRKNQKCPFWLKIRTYGILEVLIANPDLDFWKSDSEIHFWANFGPKKSKLSVLPKNLHAWYLEDADSYSDISFLNLQV